ncbi:LLM class flavin-dependent oxidoreductase [Candidatus Thorarchaeota archaeon]|nr:MAG: LLM class flavin-dependent oxidoreductase [Candidatus Thorarchaeota archaeon]
MEWGIAINLREPVDEIVEKAVLADKGGIDTIWITDYPATRVSPLLAAVVAQKTEECRIGVGLLSPLIYSTSQILQYITSLIDHYGDRFDLLLGPGDRIKLETIGVSYSSAPNLVQNMMIVANEIKKGLPKDCDCRIFLGAQGPKMVSASSQSDGVLLNYADLQMINWAKSLITNVVKGFKIGIFVPALIGSSKLCKDHLGLRTSAAVVALGLSRSVMKVFELQKPLMSSCALLKRRKYIDEDVVNLIEQSILDRFCICGGKEVLKKYITNLIGLAIDVIVFGPPQGASLKGVRELINAKIYCEQRTTH